MSVLKLASVVSLDGLVALIGRGSQPRISSQPFRRSLLVSFAKPLADAPLLLSLHGTDATVALCTCRQRRYSG
jgi:hypothetical protein